MFSHRQLYEVMVEFWSDYFNIHLLNTLGPAVKSKGNQLVIRELAQAIGAFYTDMGPQMQRITVLVHTEFGRRVAENASLGADHGTGSLAYAIGGGVNGGQIISDWPGLATQDLEMGEDLRITTDLHTVMSDLLNKRLGGTDITQVFRV